MPSRRRPPAIALALGYAGLLPFVALAVAAVLAPEETAGFAQRALLGYGATILSFLGGVHWGLALAARDAQAGRVIGALSLGVLPQLLGWAALLAPGNTGAFLTAAGLIAVLALDRTARRYGWAPDWFFALRWPLSVGAASSLTVAALLS